MKRLVNPILRCTLLAVGLTFATEAVAGDDFGIWTDIGLKKEWTKKFSTDFGFEYRANDKLKNSSRLSFDLGASYKPWKFLKVGIGYVFIEDHSQIERKINLNKEGEEKGYNIDHAFWRPKHRFLVEATGSVDAGRFTFSLRERYQITHTPEATTTRERYRDRVTPGFSTDKPIYNGYYLDDRVETQKKAKTEQYLRSRLGVDYNIKGIPLTPFATYEFSNNLKDGFHLDKTRLTIGADYKIKKQHTLTLGYIYTKGHDDDNIKDTHAINVGYSFKF